ncbi:MAG: glycosyltransferase family 39 protein [Candidatus Omnitrophica bacterium]|nr:glycosyltransferase family 39 protein [Candidatus Omnitrophota bacterium]
MFEERPVARDPWAWGLLVAAALLLLPNLESSGLLWQDEAETAVLAQRTLAFGYPKADDGINRLNPALPMGPGESWTYHPWLQFYVTAVSLRLFGATTAAARFPFALIGVVCIVLAYRVTLALLHDPGIARLTGLFTLLSVPLLLHFRQCRYYALGVLGLLWVLWAFQQTREGRRNGWWWLAAGLIVLFHAHHGAWVPTIAALGWWVWRHRIAGGHWRTAWAAAGVTAVATLPWFCLLNPFDPSQHQAAFSLREAGRHAQFYVRQINRFIVPLQLFLLMWLLRGLRPQPTRGVAPPGDRPGGPLPGSAPGHEGNPQATGLIITLVAAHLAFLVLVPEQRHFRYLIQLMPLLFMGQSILLWAWLGRRPAALTVVSALLITTDVLHYSAPYVIAETIPPLKTRLVETHAPVRPRSLLWEYGYELTHRYRGPLDGIIGTLRREARPGDTVKTPYDDHAVIFYTGLRVEDVNRFAEPTFPAWIIPRRDWVAGDFWTSPYFQAMQRTYTRLNTDVPDLPWENRPDPGYHKFRTVEEAPCVVLYHRSSSEVAP